MSLIDKVLKRIETNQKADVNCLPFSSIYPRFAKYVPGTKRGCYYAITGTPGAAKTQFTDFTFLYNALDEAELHKIDLEIIYFSFEISKESKILKGISKKLFTDYGLKISSNVLDGLGDLRLTEDQHLKVLKTRDYFSKLESRVTFYDEPLTPSQIFKIMMDKMKENGSYDPSKSVYTPDNPNKYVVFITDHISLIPPDPGQSQHQALTVFSANNIFLRNKFGATIINVHQQGTEGSVQQFTNKGDNIVGKLEPKLAGLGDNRTLGRDYDIVLGLFSPSNHEIDFYKGYKTKRFGDRCRWLSIIKNRDGEQDKNVGLYFDGAVGYFEELPKSEEFTVLKMGQKTDNEELYQKYEKGLVGLLDTNRQRLFSFP